MARTIQEAFTTFDRAKAAEKTKQAELIRRDFVSKFPLSGWSEMPLERYALGIGSTADSFSGCLEFRTPGLGGIGGGASAKHVIFKRKGRPGWYYPQQFQNEQEAWRHLRAAVVEMLQRAQEGRWEAAAELLPFQYAVSIWVKTLHIYFPEQVLAIYSREHLKHFWHALTGEEAKSVKGVAPLLLNRQLLQHLRGVPELTSLDTRELMYFLYEWNDPRAGVSIYKISPGEDAKLWPECLAGQYMAVGWPSAGDVTAFEDFESFDKRFREAYGPEYGDTAAGKATTTRKSKEVWRLSRIEPGDLIVANKGKSEILAVGEVQDPPYEFAGEGLKYPHRVKVRWDVSKARDIPAQSKWAFVTIAPISIEEYERMMAGPGPRPTGRDIVPPVNADPELVQLADRLEQRKQLILYGPPGTGKTFTARRFLLHWLLSAEGMRAGEILADEDRASAAWSTLTSPSSGSSCPQVTMLTFHPSYGYEDFVEGYRPEKSSDGGLRLSLEPGVFLRVCDAAAALPSRRFVVLIDEINRGNLPRILGELVTVLEADKRGLKVMLPQSKKLFTVPPNVFIVGTMNTADRSIRVLDAAIRRRFAFHELMPDSSRLEGRQFGDLVLEDFLDYLNSLIIKKEGREKQIGHAVFMEDAEPIDSVEEFARRFRHEVIPLLQEYCYEDYRSLAEYLGPDLVDVETQRLKTDILGQPEALAAALARRMGLAVP